MALTGQSPHEDFENQRAVWLRRLGRSVRRLRFVAHRSVRSTTRAYRGPDRVDNILDMSALKTSMVPGTLDVATVGGKTYGLMIAMNVKGLVFYPKKAFDAAGYTAPTTIDGLNSLADQMRADGRTPWCLGIESGTATGWSATDWFENLVLKYGGVGPYNQWIAHTMKFDSPLVLQAANEFSTVAFTNGNVLGGRKSIASNNFGTAGNAMFNAKPGCMMYIKGSFITGFFPKNIQSDLDNQVGPTGAPPEAQGCRRRQ